MFVHCLYDEADSLVASLAVDRAGDVCAGRACWKATGGEPPAGKGFLYKDKELAADGVQLLKLRAGAAGRTGLLLKAKNHAARGSAALPGGLVDALAGSARVTSRLYASTGECWSAVLTDVSAGPGLVKAR